MSSLLVHPQSSPLIGRATAPGDKSISHRILMLAPLAEGTSMVEGWLPAGDTLSTLDVMRALGAQITVEQVEDSSWGLTIEGRGMTGLRPPPGPLDCGNAGTCIRLMAGLLAGQPFPTVLDGSGQLRRRPMRRVAEPLRLMGAYIEDDEGHAPLAIRPAPLHGITYELPVASAQVKSAILLAGLYAQGETNILDSATTRDHTERLLRFMGVPITLTRHSSHITAHSSFTLHPVYFVLPGDFSSAAFLLSAAAVVPGSRLTIAGCGANPTRTGLLDILRDMSADLCLDSPGEAGPEPVADIALEARPLQATGVAGDLVVRAIDELPVWAVLATQAEGTSELRGAAELRNKEVDRIAALAEELRKMGAQIRELDDGMTIRGQVRLRGAEVDSHGDHRIGMALAVAGLTAAGPTLVQNAACIADSFPRFAETLNALGARLEWLV